VAWAHKIAQTQRVITPVVKNLYSSHPPAPKKTPGNFGNIVNSALKNHKTDEGEKAGIPHLKDYMSNTISKKGG
jgi:hypothetical protein